MLYLNLSALQTKTWVVTAGREKAIGRGICVTILQNLNFSLDPQSWNILHIVVAAVFYWGHW